MKKYTAEEYKKLHKPNIKYWLGFVGTTNCKDEPITKEMIEKWVNNPKPEIECVFCGGTKPYDGAKSLTCFGCREYKGIQPYIPEWSDWG